MSEYTSSSSKGNYSSSSESSGYTSGLESNTYSRDTSLRVIQYQVKESKKGICTCNGGKCRATCIST